MTESVPTAIGLLSLWSLASPAPFAWHWELERGPSPESGKCHELLASQLASSTHNMLGLDAMIRGDRAVVIATVTAIDPGTGTVRLDISSTLYGTTPATVVLPLSRAPVELVQGSGYLVAYRLVNSSWIAVATPSQDLIHLVQRYATLRAAVPAGESAVDSDGALRSELRRLVTVDSQAGQVARDFVVHGRLRGSTSQFGQSCCRLAETLTDEDWTAIKAYVQDPEFQPGARLGFLSEIRDSARSRVDPELVVPVLDSYATLLAAGNGGRLTGYDESYVVHEAEDWGHHFAVSERIRLFQLYQACRSPALVRIGNGLRFMDWYRAR